MTERIQAGIARLGDVGASMAAWVGTMNVWTAALFALAFAADRLLARRVGAAWRTALYAPVALRLLLPAWLTISVPLPPAMWPAAGPDAAWSVVPAVADQAPGAAAAVAGASTSGVPWAAFVPAAYLAGVVVLALRWRRQRAALARLCSDATEAPPWLRGLGRDFDIVEHRDAGPILVGTRMPRLVLPSGLRERVGEDGVRAIVRHEAVHVRRRDPWTVAILHAAVIAAWPVAAAWWAVSRVRVLLEVACDERALAGADATSRRAYGEALIALASGRGASLAVLGFGDALRERIAGLGMDRTRWSRTRQAAIVTGLCALLAACASTHVERDAAATAQIADRDDAAAPEYLLEFQVLRQPVLSKDGQMASMAEDQAAAALAASGVGVITAPRLVTTAGSPASISIGSNEGRIEISALIERSPRGGRTLKVTFSDRDDDRVVASTETLVLVADRITIEIPVDGREAKALMVTVRAPEGRVDVPLLRDLPLLDMKFRNAPDAHDGSTPQVLSAMRVIETDDPLALLPEVTLLRNAEFGTATCVLSADQMAAVADELGGRAGATQLAAPTVLSRMGEAAAIEVGSSGQDGPAASGLRIEVT